MATRSAEALLCHHTATDRKPMNPHESLSSREKAKLRFTLAGVREINLASEQSEADLETCARFLNQPSNRDHFASPPTTSEGMRALCSSPGVHPLIAENKLGEIVGGMIIRDAEPMQHDHWLEKAVVDTQLQGRGLGRQMLKKGIEWAFTTLTIDGRRRMKLDTSIIMFVKGWERMYHLVESLGFEFRMILPDQVDVPMRRGIETKHTTRWELRRSNWERYNLSHQAQVPPSSLAS